MISGSGDTLERVNWMIESLGGSPAEGAALSWSEREGWRPSFGRLGREAALTLYLDGMELATLLCTPEKLNCLVVGFLADEGLIEGLADISLLRVCEDEGVADVQLVTPREVVAKRILTSGCGGGVTFDEGSSLAPVSSGTTMAPERLLAGMRRLVRSGEKFSDRGGLHASALFDGDDLLVVSRDVGRHNTLDKIRGECILRGMETRDRLLLTTGRISSEMVVKAARMNVPIAASLNLPTDRAVGLAGRLGIAVVGYVRGGRLTVYSCPERLGGAMVPDRHGEVT